MRAPFVLILAACGAPSAEKAGPAPSGEPAGGVLHLDPPSGKGAMAPNLVPGGPGEAILSWIEPTADGHPGARPTRQLLRAADEEDGAGQCASRSGPHGYRC